MQNAAKCWIRLLLARTSRTIFDGGQTFLSPPWTSGRTTLGLAARVIDVRSDQLRVQEVRKSHGKVHYCSRNWMMVTNTSYCSYLQLDSVCQYCVCFNFIQDCFVVIASDGVWGPVTDGEAQL